MNKIKELRERSGLTQKQLADRVNVGLSTVTHWEQSLRFPNSIQRNKLCQVFKCTESDLFLTVPRTAIIKDVKIPIVSMARGDDDEGFEFEQIDPHEYEYIDFSRCKAIKITSNSMAPIAYKGQNIIYCEDMVVEDGDLVFIGLKTGEQYFKRLAKDGKSKYLTLEPINVVHYKSKTIRQDQVKFIYKVVGVKF